MSAITLDDLNKFMQLKELMTPTHIERATGFVAKTVILFAAVIGGAILGGVIPLQSTTWVGVTFSLGSALGSGICFAVALPVMSTVDDMVQEKVFKRVRTEIGRQTQQRQGEVRAEQKEWQRQLCRLQDKAAGARKEAGQNDDSDDEEAASEASQHAGPPPYERHSV